MLFDQGFRFFLMLVLLWDREGRGIVCVKLTGNHRSVIIVL